MLSTLYSFSISFIYDRADLLFLHTPFLYVGVLSLNGSNNISIVALGVTKDLTSDNNRYRHTGSGIASKAYSRTAFSASPYRLILVTDLTFSGVWISFHDTLVMPFDMT